MSLVAWRLGARVDQYRPTPAGRSQSVSFFDANEGNVALLDEAGRPSRAGDETCDRLFLALPVESPGWPARVSRQDEPLLPSLNVQPVSLFSNPPPLSLA
ncbi:hypothetical protein [Granulicella rosea]|uniref:hypothetical protein n=1 Tax=Granulicella rosea TaxID=474952 RepID=UPI00115F22D4|nr:hypothetical protein [Granulicella rosea]